MFRYSPSASSLTNTPERKEIKESTYLPPSMKTARSTTITSRLPWEESPHTTRPPSVSPSEGSTATPSEQSSNYEGPVEIQSTATPSEGSSLYERPVGIQSTSTSSDDNYFHQKFKTRPR